MFERLLTKVMLAALLAILVGCGQESGSADSSEGSLADEMKGQIDAAQEAAGNLQQRSSEMADKAGQMVNDAAEQAGQMAEDAAEQAGQMADEAADKAGQMADDLMDEVEETSDQAGQAIKDAF